MIKELINLANSLDSRGYRKEASYVDRVIKKAAGVNLNLSDAETDELAGWAGSMAGAGAASVSGAEAGAGAGYFIGGAPAGVLALLASAGILSAWISLEGFKAQDLSRMALNKTTVQFFNNVLKRALSASLKNRRRSGEITDQKQIRAEHAAIMNNKPTKAMLGRLTIGEINREFENLKNSVSAEYTREGSLERLKGELFGAMDR